jgi:hypothetical protein
MSGWSTLRLSSSRRNYPTTLYLGDVPVMTALVLAPDQGATVTLTAGPSKEFGLGPNAKPSTVSGVEYSFVDATPNYIIYRRTNDSVLVSGLSSLTSAGGSSLLSSSSSSLGPEGSLGSGSVSSQSSSASSAVPSSASSESGASSAAASSGPKLSGGAIAGIAIGGVAGLLLVILAAFFLLRQRKKARLASGAGGADRRIPEVDGSSSKRRELPGHGRTQELATETSELGGDPPPNEHAYGRAGLAPIVHHEASHGTAPTANVGGSEASPHVHAQKKREVEWLEAEEARLRQRREQLMQ